MAILKHIPKKTQIVDHRNSEGGYFVAICDVCGREYYPKRSTSKYCSASCGMTAYRTKVSEKTVKKDNFDTVIVEGTLNKCSEFFKEYRLKGAFRTFAPDIEIGYYDDFKQWKVERISANKYKVYK